jgi:hypothetical protein
VEKIPAKTRQKVKIPKVVVIDIIFASCFVFVLEKPAIFIAIKGKTQGIKFSITPAKKPKKAICKTSNIDSIKFF